MEIEIQIADFEGLIQSVQDMAEKLPDIINEIMTNDASDGKAYMDSLTPVRSGRLRDGNVVEVTGTELTVSNEVPYAADVNYGTRYMAPRPFYDPAVDYIGRQLEHDFERSLG